MKNKTNFYSLQHRPSTHCGRCFLILKPQRRSNRAKKNQEKKKRCAGRKAASLDFHWNRTIRALSSFDGILCFYILINTPFTLSSLSLQLSSERMSIVLSFVFVVFFDMNYWRCKKLKHNYPPRKLPVTIGRDCQVKTLLAHRSTTAAGISTSLIISAHTPSSIDFQPPYYSRHTTAMKRELNETVYT